MNVFENTIFKKLIITLCMVMILFTFFIPKKVHAGIWEDMLIAPAAIFYNMEIGILDLLNTTMTDESHRDKRYVSPETVIKGKFLLLEPNIFKDVSDNSKDYYDAKAVSEGKSTLRKIFSRWYYALRTLAITALLSILVYVAIRMIISSASQDKAKYKVMLKDWLVALCLLFAMHYIMVGILNMSSLITKAIGTTGENLPLTERSINIIANVLDDGNKSDGVYLWKDTEGEYGEKDKQYGTWEAYGQVVVLGAVVVYTLIFVVKYIKRMLTILFLILIAPISCITYPIDKIADGKAQAYNRWFQEFFFQVIIQPFHLLIYVVLVGSAITLASNNILYAIMCFAVMMPAEKFVREMFGFKDKLGSPLGDIMKANLASNALNKIMNGGSKQGGGENKNIQDTSIPTPKEKIGLPGADGTDGSNMPGGDSTSTETNPGVNATTENALETDVATATAVGTGVATEEALDRGITREEDNSLNEEQTRRLAEGISNGTKKTNEKGEIINSKNEKENGSWRRAHDAMESKMKEKRLQKYGNTKFLGGGKQFGKRQLGRLGRAGKKTIKGAITLGAATALGLGGAMFGKGKEGAALGAALGNKIGSGINNKLDTGVDYLKTGWDAAGGKDAEKEKEKKEFKKNANNIKLAKANYNERNGVPPNAEKLEEELDNMFYMNSKGVNQDQYNDVLSQYEKYVENGMDENEALDTAMLSAIYAQDLKRKDFMDEKVMNNTEKALLAEYGDTPRADEKVYQILSGAAAMRGVKKAALTVPSKPLSLPEKTLQMRGKSTPTQVEIKREQELQLELTDAGLDTNQIIRISQNENFETMVEDIIKIKAEYKKGDGKLKQQLHTFLGDDSTELDVNNEIINRLEIKYDTGIKEKITSAKMQALSAYESNMQHENQNINIKSTRKKSVNLNSGNMSQVDKQNLTDNEKKIAEEYKKLIEGDKEALKTVLKDYKAKK